MIAARVFVDGRCPAELSPSDYRRGVQQSALIQVFDECTEGLVEVREVLFGNLEVVSMPVPKRIAERHDSHARFDQSPR